MDTPKAIVAGLVVTLGLLAATFGLEAVAQVAGPEEIEEEHTEELDDGSHDEEDEDEVELGPEDEEHEEG